MSMNVNIDETWVPEPELLEVAPRRIVAFSDYPDRNRPNVLAFSGIAGVFLVAGVFLYLRSITHQSGGNIPLSIPLILLGFFGLVYFPYRLRQHLSRAQHLITNGSPVMARILSADNLNGDTYARNVKYQISLPGGDLGHREVYVDDRVLPKRIPANTTALMDMKTGDVEIYVALPYRAIPKATPLKAALLSDPKPVVNVPQEMGTIAVSNAPEIKREKPKDETPQPKRETFE